MLRKLLDKDADKMLEWMHDETVNQNFRFDFAGMTKERALNFIANSFTEENQHFAIVDDSDEYLGTISLKNISTVDKNAEYAIVVRKSFWGTGVAKKATDEILKYAFENLKLHRVYLNVLDENIRANKFYQKYGFIYEGQFKQHLNLKVKIGGGYKLQGFELVRAHKR